MKLEINPAALPHIARLTNDKGETIAIMSSLPPGMPLIHSLKHGATGKGAKNV